MTTGIRLVKGSDQNITLNEVLIGDVSLYAASILFFFASLASRHYGDIIRTMYFISLASRAECGLHFARDTPTKAKAKRCKRANTFERIARALSGRSVGKRNLRLKCEIIVSHGHSGRKYKSTCPTTSISWRSCCDTSYLCKKTATIQRAWTFAKGRFWRLVAVDERQEEISSRNFIYLDTKTVSLILLPCFFFCRLLFLLFAIVKKSNRV